MRGAAVPASATAVEPVAEVAVVVDVAAEPEVAVAPTPPIAAAATDAAQAACADTSVTPPSPPPRPKSLAKPPRRLQQHPLRRAPPTARDTSATGAPVQAAAAVATDARHLAHIAPLPAAIARPPHPLGAGGQGSRKSPPPVASAFDVAVAAAPPPPPLARELRGPQRRAGDPLAGDPTLGLQGTSPLAPAGASQPAVVSDVARLILPALASPRPLRRA
jgi:hypothetical protein